MGNLEDNGYSREFVDGVIRDYLAWKNKNTSDPDADNANGNQRITGYKVISTANPGVAPVNNNQRVAGQEVILDKAGEGKQRILQTNNNQNAGYSQKDAFFKMMEKEVGELGDGTKAYGKYQEMLDKGVWFDVPREFIEKIKKLLN